MPASTFMPPRTPGWCRESAPSVGTGIAVAVPPGHAGLVLARSGLAARHGIALVNAPGLIDAGYRGELRVLLLNTDNEQAFELAAGDRIAQLVLVRVEELELEEAPSSTRPAAARPASDPAAADPLSPIRVRWRRFGLARR